MKYVLKDNGGQLAVALSEKIYAHDAGVIRDVLVAQIQQGVKHVRLDMSDVTYIDSSGLGVLVTIHKLTKEAAGQLVLAGVQGIVGELLRRTRLDKVFAIE